MVMQSLEVAKFRGLAILKINRDMAMLVVELRKESAYRYMGY
jgi:hypothetical protein